MKTDLLLVPMSARWADMRAAALAAEAARFDGIWTWDHLRDPDERDGPGVPEAWTVLTALAEVTRRVALGPLVLNVANRVPGVLASMAATLQAVSAGDCCSASARAAIDARRTRRSRRPSVSTSAPTLSARSAWSTRSR